MFKGLVTLIGTNSVAMLLTTVTTLSIAGALGPHQFGDFALAQAIAAILSPITMFRFETRILLANSHDHLAETFRACITLSGVTSAIGLAIATVLSITQLAPESITFSAIAIAISSALIEASTYLEAHWGNTKNVAGLRFFRSVIPGLAGGATALLTKNLHACFAAYVTALTLVAALAVYRTKLAIFSLATIKQVFKRNAGGIRSAFFLGVLNAIWLNAILPLMQFLGMDVIAGQYAIAQRLINAPLSVIGSAVNTLLFSRNDFTHKSSKRIIRLTFLCLIFSLIYCAFLFSAMYIQPWFILPSKWLMDQYFFGVASFFLVSSFAVGSVSTIAIKQKDERFILFWQILFLAAYIGIVSLLPNNNGITTVFVLGGFAYWILLWRWIWIAKVNDENKAD